LEDEHVVLLTPLNTKRRSESSPEEVLSSARVTPSREIKRQRRRQGHGCWDHLIVAPLWPKYGENLGTLLRTCDAVGACMAVPRRPWVPDALAKGNTLRRPACVHWTDADPVAWLERQKQRDGTRIVGVELADEAIRLGDLPAARTRTIMVLGHERDGIPPEAMDLVDVAVEIPMIGWGASLNVAVAGSLVLYRLAGFL
jgi:tRNA (guanosine-2'-O-)-methyltransferase